MMVILIIGGIMFAVFLLPRIIAKGMGTAIDAGQKAVFKKQIAESDDLIDVPLVLTSSATPAVILDALDAIIRPSKEPPGFESLLYQVSREPMRAVYAIGNKVQPQQLVTELRLSEQGGKTEMVFRVLAAMRTENIFIYKGALIRLREQVQYVAECGTDQAKLAEGVYMYRSAEADEPKWSTALGRLGGALVVGAVIWLAVGVQIRLLPVLFLLFAAGGALIYLSNKSVSKRRRESSAAAARVLHPGLAQDAAPQAAAAASEAAAVEPAVAAAPATPGAPSSSGPGLVARFNAMPQQAKLVVVGGTVVTVLLLVIVVPLSTGNSRNSYADQSDVYVEEGYSYEGDEVAVEPDPVADSAYAQALTEDDLFSSAPSDGSMEFAEVVYGGVVEWYGGSEALIDFTIVSRSPEEWYTAGLPTDVGCYVDYKQVSFSNYSTAMSESDDRRGMIVFNNQGLYELHVLTQGQKVSARTPDKNQVVIVPEYMQLDLPYAEWADLGQDSAMEAHDSAVEQAFADVGLIAVIRRVPATDDSEPTQDPMAGSTVPVGTKVYITIPSSD